MEIKITMLFVLLVFVYVLANTVLWVIALISMGRAGKDNDENMKAEAMLQSTVTEILNMFKNVESMTGEIRAELSAKAETKEEVKVEVRVPEELQQKLEAISGDVLDGVRKETKELFEANEGLKADFESNAEKVGEKIGELEKLMRDIDAGLVKLTQPGQEKKEA